MTYTRRIKIAIIMMFLLVMGAMMTIGWDDIGDWTFPETGEKIAINPLYFEYNNTDCRIEMVYDRIYLDCPDGVRITDDNKTLWGDLYAGEIYAQALHVDNYTVNNTLDYNITGDINASGNITANNIIISGNKGIIYDTIRSVWAFKFMNGLGADNVGLYFDVDTSQMKLNWLNYTGWAISINGDTQHGLALADYDLTETFLGTTNNGTRQWMNTEDYFKFNDDIWLPTTEYLYFAATTNFITDDSNAIHISAPNGIKLGNAQAGIDYKILFDGQDNDGTIEWQEDEKEFNITNSVVIEENLTVEGTPNHQWWFEPQYISIETHAVKTTSSAAEINPFDNSSYAANAYDYHIHTQNGINYDNTTGEFQVTQSGIYEINSDIVTECAGVMLVTIKLYHDTVVDWESNYTIHSSVDPLPLIEMMQSDLNALQNITVTYDSQGASGCTANPGTSINIKKIANTLTA